MATKRTERTNSFQARDVSGNRFRINELTEFHIGHSSDGPYRVEGCKSLILDDGTPVNFEGQGRYRAIGVEEIELFTDAPKAV